MNCMGSSEHQHIAAMVRLGMFLTTRMLIPEEHSCVGTGEGPP